MTKNHSHVSAAFSLLLIYWISISTAFAEDAPVKSLIEIRRDGVVMQEWDLSCGAAALATLLKYQHGDPVSEKEIAQALISRDEYLENPALIKMRQGFSLLDLKRYVDSRGHKGIGLGRLDLDDLVRRAPIMVPVQLHGYNHFVIIRGLRGNRVLLADPAWGNRTMLKNRFERAWLEYPEFGRVGFVITRTDGSKSILNQLMPRKDDYLFLR